MCLRDLTLSIGPTYFLPITTVDETMCNAIKVNRPSTGKQIPFLISRSLLVVLTVWNWRDKRITIYSVGWITVKKIFSLSVPYFSLKTCNSQENIFLRSTRKWENSISYIIQNIFNIICTESYISPEKLFNICLASIYAQIMIPCEFLDFLDLFRYY